MSTKNFEDYFSLQIFLIFLRESLEIIIIVSILLTIVKQALFTHDSSRDTLRAQEYTVEEEEVVELMEDGNIQNAVSGGVRPSDVSSEKLYKKLKFQIIAGGALGLLSCMLIGGSFIVAFYYIGTDLWSMSEHYYESALSILASVIISLMGLFFLRMGKLREKFRIKLASIIYSDRLLDCNGESSTAKTFGEKNALFILPFVTTLREGLEAVVFMGGVGIDSPLSSIPLSMLAATSLSSIFGFYFYKYSKSFSLQVCLVITTCMLYLIAGGLFSKGVWQYDVQKYVDACHGQDMSEVGNGPGSYDIARSVWHVNCCNGERDGLWMIFTAIFGWTNSATYGSVISYNVYWLVVILAIKVLMVEEREGYIPFLPIKFQRKRIQKRLAIAEKSLALKIQSSANGSSSSPYSPSNISERRSTDSKHSCAPLLSSSEGVTSYQ